LIGNVLNGFQTGGAEPVDGTCPGGIRKACGEGGGAGVVGGMRVVNLLMFLALGNNVDGRRDGKTYVTNADVLHHLRIDSGLPKYLDHKLVEDAINGSVFEPAFAALGQRCSDGKRYDDVVWVFGGSGMKAVNILRLRIPDAALTWQRAHFCWGSSAR